MPNQSLLAHAPAARRLQEVTQSIESFFQTQLKRLEQALASCQRNAKEGETVQRILDSALKESDSGTRERLLTDRWSDTNDEAQWSEDAAVAISEGRDCRPTPSPD